MNTAESDWDYCKHAIQRVSRSFAYGLLRLESQDRNLGREFVILYLLCRVLDTVEDSDLAIGRKSDLIRLILEEIRSGSLHKIETMTGVNEDSRDLVTARQVIYREFARQRPEYQEFSLKCLEEMGFGMASFQTQVIHGFEDLDRYCHYVAGTVGICLTQLAIPQASPETLELAERFGRLLQLVNIILDFFEDQREHRVYWPSSLLNVHGEFDSESHRRIIAHAWDQVPYAERYLQIVGASALEQNSFLEFCRLPFELAKASLDLASDPDHFFSQRARPKVDKEKFRALVDVIELA